MDPDLISKKDLLELTGLSYGQLYRWKRKNLIPEAWFIRKSTFTGQETFFPKQQMLLRIEKIKHMKDDLSLDELADLLSPSPTLISLSKQELVERNIVSEMSIEHYFKRFGDSAAFSFEQILKLFIFDQMLQTGEINLDEGYMLLQVMNEHYPKLEDNNGELILIRKMGFSTFILAASPAHVYFEPNVRVVTRLSLSDCLQELKLKLN
jgi:DNA-binding transcriptional MerR regulator